MGACQTHCSYWKMHPINFNPTFNHFIPTFNNSNHVDFDTNSIVANVLRHLIEFFKHPFSRVLLMFNKS